MTSAFNSKSGVTLFETLIALTVVALLFGVVTISVRPPSPAMRLEREISSILAETSALRLRAIRQDETVRWRARSPCEAQQSDTVFFSDGTARGQDICLDVDGASDRLTLNSLIGRYVREGTE